MISTERDLRAIATTVLEASHADATEVLIEDNDTALTRFANNEIHQNVAERTVSVRVRALRGKRAGVASTTQLTDKALRDAVRVAYETAASQPEDESLPGLPLPKEARPVSVDARTARATPEERAELVAGICRLAAERDVRAFGAISTGQKRYAVANSNGLYLESPRAVADLSIVTMTEGGTGYADRSSSRLDDVDAAGAGAEAVDKALRTRGAEPIEPGVYPVILEESAVAKLLEFISYIGMSGLAVEEGRTFIRPGERITGDAISLWDDGHDPSGLPMPFDFEGVPKQRVDIITGGVATGVVHDLASAARAGVGSTGHGLPAPNPMGAIPLNLFMAGGDAASTEDLLEGIERGVWVTRFHYVNVVQPRQSQLTGMTRDGTFLIEKGKVTRPIKDMRFTQSIMDAFATADGITRETRVVAGEDYDFTAGYRAPAMRMQRFNFSSVTR